MEANKNFCHSKHLHKKEMIANFHFSYYRSIETSSSSHMASEKKIFEYFLANLAFRSPQPIKFSCLEKKSKCW